MTVGHAPQNWEKTSLGELATVFQGQSPPGSTYNEDGVGLPFLQGSADFGDLNPTPTKWCSEPIRVAEQGDILISIRAPVGPTNVADQRYCIGRGLAAIRASRSIEPAFLLHQLRHSVAALVDRATGTTFDAIGGSVLREHAVSIAPLPEQRRIVDAIESYLSCLDDAVASLERVLAKLKAYRASVLKAAVEGRLVLTEASLARAEKRDYEPAEALLARILKERRRRWEETELAKLKAAGKTPKDDKWKAKYEEPVTPDANTLPALPEGWCWTSLGQAFTVTVGATPSRSVPEYWNGGIPWVSSGEVSFCRIRDTRETITSAGLDSSSTKLNPRGSVLVGMIGEGKTRGQAAILDIDACGNQNAAAVWVSQTEVPPEYVYHYLVGQYETTRRRGSGNNQPALNKARVEAIPLPLPPLEEQKRIVDRLERDDSTIADAEATVERERKRIHRLRQAILKWAFEGRLVDQDPTDEPAEKLLDRIRAERAAVAPAEKSGRRTAKGAA
jgi:type I restriction enzyme S subunit